jgi:hypothetical protein
MRSWGRIPFFRKANFLLFLKKKKQKDFYSQRWGRIFRHERGIRAAPARKLKVF